MVIVSRLLLIIGILLNSFLSVYICYAYDTKGDFFESVRTECSDCHLNKLFLHYAQQGRLYLLEHFFK